jgi:hypothetical protein
LSFSPAFSHTAVPPQMSVTRHNVTMEVGFMKKNGQRLIAARKFTQA